MTRVWLALFVIVTLVGGCSIGPAKPPGPAHVTLTLDWVPNTNHTGFFVALDKGWYTEAGLDVEIQTPSDPAAALKQVAYGHTEFGISFQEETTIARAQGIPVVSIAAIIQHNTSAFASLRERGITRPKQFEGRKYASSGAILERPVLKGLMACDAGEVDKVEFVDVGFDILPAIISGKADYGWIFIAWEGIQAEIMGRSLNLVTLEGSCVPDYYTPIVITGETTIEKRRDLVRKFMTATSKGFEYAIAHPAEAAEILLKHAPETDPELVRQSQAWLSPRYQAEAPRWGGQKLETWTAFARWMTDNGVLAGPFDPEKAFTNEFLP